MVRELAAQPADDLLGRVAPAEIFLHLAAQLDVGHELGRLGAARTLIRQRGRRRRAIPTRRARVAGQLPTDRRRAASQPPGDRPHRLTTSPRDRDLFPLRTRQAPTLEVATAARPRAPALAAHSANDKHRRLRSRPRRGVKGRCLSFAEREEIAVARAGGESMRSIARRLGRSLSTISRELTRNAGATGGYRATTAHALAYERASRPKPAKLVTNVELRRKVEEDLRRRYSPEQIVGRLRRQFPDDLRDAGVARNDLPIAVRPVARRVATRSDAVSSTD